jgi:ParB-like chromosome segregation protein Spo0J
MTSSKKKAAENEAAIAAFKDKQRRGEPSKMEYAFHELANKFDLLEGAEFDELVADIKKHGQREPSVLHEDKVLDGRNRYRACRAADIVPRYEMFTGGDPRAFVISANIRRRHLTFDRRCELARELLADAPTMSDRQVAATVKVSPTTVGKVRAEKEATGDVATVARQLSTVDS